jgi:hypothetical protein
MPRPDRALPHVKQRELLEVRHDVPVERELRFHHSSCTISIRFAANQSASSFRRTNVRSAGAHQAIRTPIHASTRPTANPDPGAASSLSDARLSDAPHWALLPTSPPAYSPQAAASDVAASHHHSPPPHEHNPHLTLESHGGHPPDKELSSRPDARRGRLRRHSVIPLRLGLTLHSEEQPASSPRSPPPTVRNPDRELRYRPPQPLHVGAAHLTRIRPGVDSVEYFATYPATCAALNASEP